MRKIDDIAQDLVANRVYTPSTMAKFVELCNFMRYSFIICDVHHKMEANIDEQVCELCKDNLIGSKF